MRKTMILALFLTVLGCGESPTAITIDLSGATALIKASSNSSSGLTVQSVTQEESLGYLRKLLDDGTISPVIYETDGQVASDVEPTSVFVGPDGKVYIFFIYGGVTISGEECYLIRGTTDGEPECYGPDDGMENNGHLSDKNPFRISSHFDSSNNFYFVEDGRMPDSAIYFQLLSPSGVVSDVVTLREVDMESFAIGRDGTIYFAGRTESTQATFFRRTTAAGGFENLDAPTSRRDYIVSADGDLFVLGSDDNSVDNVYRGGTGSDDITFEEIDLGSINDSNSEVPAIVTSAYGVSSNNQPNGLIEDLLGNIYLLGFYYDDENAVTYRVYPGDPVRVTNSAHDIVLARTSGNYLYYSGLSGTTNIFYRVNLTDDTFQATDLLNGEDIEVYRFAVKSNGNILFGGLRLSDAQLIIAEIDGGTLDMATVATATTRIDELVLVE